MPIANVAVALAVAKLYGKEAADNVRDAVGPGEYPIDAVVAFNGRLKVGNDYRAKNHQRLNPLKLIAILLDGIPKQVRNARIREAIARIAAGEVPDVDDLKAETDAAVAELMQATEEPARGRATYIGDAVLAGGVIVPV